MVNRKLIRPNLADLKGKMTTAKPRPSHGAAGAREGAAVAAGPRRRAVPPDQTSAEAFYYLKQMNNRTPMVVVLDNEDQLRGHIEWYDRNCIKVHREGSPNILVFKHAIKYMYKLEEEDPEAAENYSGE